MTIQKDSTEILDMLTCPGFCVQNNRITRVNQAAASMFLIPGTDIQPLLETGSEEYAEFNSGCLCLTLKLHNQSWTASVIRREEEDFFLLERQLEDESLQALALAAKELRGTMTGTLISADQLSKKLDPQDQQIQDQLARLNQSLYRTLRIISNMSDASGWPHLNRQEVRNISAIFREIFEKAQTLAESVHVKISYQGLAQDVHTLADQEQLERAVLNILSNALKFMPGGGTIQATLTRKGRMLRLTIQDSGFGIPENIRATLFRRYLRQSSLEDSRYGLGLGLVIVQSAAAAHGGTVLIDHPKTGGTRVTFTIAIRQDSDASFRSPIRQPDYAGEWDHALLELSDCLPHTLYQK